jgi:hypothetical protein
MTSERREAEEAEGGGGGGVQNQKQEPHTKMWGKNGGDVDVIVTCFKFTKTTYCGSQKLPIQATQIYIFGHEIDTHKSKTFNQWWQAFCSVSRAFVLPPYRRRKSLCASTPFPRILSWPLSKVALPDQSHSAQLRHLIRHACLPPPLLDLSLRLHSKPSMSGTDAPNHCRICFLISSGVASCRIEFNKVWILLANLFGSLSCRPLQANLASTLPGSRAFHGSCRALHHCVCY